MSENIEANCIICKKDCNSEILVKPLRHLTSPNPAPKYSVCSKECETEFNENKPKMYAFFAALDRNASDAECFEAEGWDGIFRVGVCRVTKTRVRVEPLMPSENSGQPRECTQHFKLRQKYRELLPEDSLWV